MKKLSFGLERQGDSDEFAMALVLVSEEIDQLNVGRPHVVVLSEAASRAAVPEVDSFGSKLPLTEDLVHVVGLEQDFLNAGIKNPTYGATSFSHYLLLSEANQNCSHILSGTGF